MVAITIPGMFLTGTHAARPAASAVGGGTLYSCSDHSLIYQSDGSAWSTWATVGGGGDGSLIGITRYQPGTDGTIRTLTTADALMDGTNLTVTFTAPASGNVLVRFNGTVNMDATAEQFWTLWEGGALIGTHRAKMGAPSEFGMRSATFYLTGVTAGPHTYQWAGYRVAGAVALLSGGPTYGAAVMEVWAA